MRALDNPESPWNPFFLERLCHLCAYRLVNAIEGPDVDLLVSELANGNAASFREQLASMKLPSDFVSMSDQEIAALFPGVEQTRAMAHIGALILAETVMPLWLELIYEAAPKASAGDTFEIPFDERFLPTDPERVEAFFRALEPIPREQVLRAIRELCMAAPTHFPEDVATLLSERLSEN